MELAETLDSEESTVEEEDKDFQIALPKSSFKRTVPQSIEDLLTDPYQHLNDLSTVPDSTLDDAAEFITERRKADQNKLKRRRKR